MRYALLGSLMSLLLAGCATRAPELPPQRLSATQGLTEVGAVAHSGRTDKNGCHMDRKAGTRHCH